MFNLIFDVEHEWFCLHFRPGALTLKQSIILSFKVFVNLFAISILLSSPAITVMLIVQLVKSLSM